jgi:hypothetical protein
LVAPEHLALVARCIHFLIEQCVLKIDDVRIAVEQALLVFIEINSFQFLVFVRPNHDLATFA